MEKPDYLISTPENVDLHLELAGVGNRIWAAFIDVVLIYLSILFLVFVGAIVAAVIEQIIPTRDAKNQLFLYLIAALSLLSFAIYTCYFILFEKLWQGQTPGKRIAQIRVIEANGQPLNWAASIIRNLVRFVDMFVFMVGVVFMIFDKNERRLGDFLGGTLVIRERAPDLSQRNLRIQTEAPNASFVDAGQLNPDDYYLLVNFLRRRHQMNSQSRFTLAKQLEDYFRLKLSPESKGESAETFLEKVYLAYTARAELEAK
ncbi:MAG: RDD family protein [Candidatus Obscuribacterales bacterium]|jgi:uncharacterized RDD family membrane protein YckC|nr:RDD family protein [Candidatus Obscuribacterales bacterium]